MDKSKKKIGVIGLGPVGMILSVHLQEAGYEVAVCDIDKIKMNLIQKEGIHLKNGINKHSYFKHVCTSIKELKELELDLLIFCLKTHQMPIVLKEVEALKNDKFGVISAQNGINTEQMLADVFGKARTFRMIVNFAGNLNAPNVVNVTFFTPPNYIASIDDSQQNTAEQLAQLLNDVDLQTNVVNANEIYKRTWEKTILNSSLSALCGIVHLSMKEVMDSSDTIEIVKQTMEEAIAVAEAENIKFPDDFVSTCMEYLKKAGNHFPSLAVDIINSRPTEIDFFNGKIVEHGKKNNIPTPLNLAFTNMVKAMSKKNVSTCLTIDGLLNKKKAGKEKTAYKEGNCFLGIDLGSAYTKFTVIDDNKNIIFQTALQTINREKIALKQVMDAIHDKYPIQYSCATGYGRKYFPDANIIKTEINCAVTGVSQYFSGAKNIIDIGGEDIKVIKCNKQNNIENFYLNNKCAAGTGSFITEIAERAEVNISEMSNFASNSCFKKELNSFCTVFAKTEIMGWLFDGTSIEDITKGIYISIANRVAKLRIDPSLTVYLIGGVIDHHPFLKNMLEEKFKQETHIIEKPLYVVSYGAALMAKNTLISTG